jgi:hypothetical protein
MCVTMRQLNDEVLETISGGGMGNLPGLMPSVAVNPLNALWISTEIKVNMATGCDVDLSGGGAAIICPLQQ